MDALVPVLPPRFEAWFAGRGWRPRPHQLELVRRAEAGLSTLLIAPTGAGKTLAGFLPSLVELAPVADAGGLKRPHKIHTLYISPLKALTTDVARNLEAPVREMQLGVRLETRTGDTPSHKRQRQRASPPDILLTTPEQLCLLIASEHARVFFEDLQCVVIDEIHAIAPTKRGDLLALALARLRRWAPGHRRVGLSATVADEPALARWLLGADAEGGEIVKAPPGAAPVIDVLDSDARIPWAGHTARHAMPEVYEAIKRARLALVFVNTRAQAEMTFQELWRINEEALPIALHHGSLDVQQRRKVEAAMARGELRAVVCTSTLDLGIDWGDVDLVIQIGAPKGCARLVQRIGRANHRLDDPSRALLAPSNRFEVLECRAAQDAVLDGALDGAEPRVGGLDCLAQHIMGCACGEPFDADELYAEVIATAPYADLSRAEFDRVIDLVATGGYALRSYDRYKRIVQELGTGRWRARNPAVAQAHRMNVGAIIESEMLDVRLAVRAGMRSRPGVAKGSAPLPMVAGQRLGQIEQYFIEGLTPGDTFLFAGQILKLISVRETDALVVRASDDNPSIPSYAGGKFPLSTFLAERVRHLLHDPKRQKKLPQQVRDWIKMQKRRSIVPAPHEMLVETFPRASKHYLVCYPFEGRLAHQTLGMLLSRRLERAGKHPLGFLASEYAVAVWALEPMGGADLAALFDEDMLGDDLEAWLTESTLMKSMFGKCAMIAGMIQRNAPAAARKTSRQVTFSADLIFDVLKQYEPDHVLMQAAFADAGQDYLDLKRLGDLLRRIKGNIVHRDLPHVSPFAAPVMLEVGRVPIQGQAEEAILEDAASLIAEAMSGACASAYSGAISLQRETGEEMRAIRAMVLALAMAPSLAYAQASDATREINVSAAANLPFADREDEDFAARGFIAAWPDNEIRGADGNVVWNFRAYDFLQGPAPETVNPSLWRHAGLLARAGLFRVTDRVFQVRGFDVANMTIVVGDSGLIIIDPLTSVEAASAALTLARQAVGDRPVVAVIYTHSHADHFGGVRGVVDPADVTAGRVQIIAPEGFMDHAISENVIAGNAMSRRAIYQFGVGTAPGPEGVMTSGIGIALSNGTMSLIAPTHSVARTGEMLTIDGVRIEFQVTPGTEAPAEMNFFFPDLGVLCLSENANATMHNILTPRGALVRDAKAWADYLTEALRLYGDRTDVMVTSHAWPRFGGERVRDFIGSHRDAYKYLHDQTVRMMNAGLTSREIAEEISLPPSLANRWFNRGYYGTMMHNSQAVYQRYMGWYDGNPSNLDRHTPGDEATRYVQAMGGSANVMAHAQEAFDSGDYRWAAVLLNHLIFASDNHAEARALLARAHRQMAFQAESAIWRNMYLTAARELESGVAPRGGVTQAADLVVATPTAQVLDLLAVRLNPERLGNRRFAFNLVFPERNESFAVTIQNGVLVHESGVTLADAPTITSPRGVFLQALGTGTMRRAVINRSIRISGDRGSLEGLNEVFDTPDPNFAIVTP